MALAAPSAPSSPASSPPAPSIPSTALASPPAPSRATGIRSLNQFIGVAIAWVLSIVGTLILLKFVDMVVGLRVTREEEIEG